MVIIACEQKNIYSDRLDFVFASTAQDIIIVTNMNVFMVYFFLLFVIVVVTLLYDKVLLKWNHVHAAVMNELWFDEMVSIRSWLARKHKTTIICDLLVFK